MTEKEKVKERERLLYVDSYPIAFFLIAVPSGGLLWMARDGMVRGWEMLLFFLASGLFVLSVLWFILFCSFRKQIDKNV